MAHAQDDPGALQLVASIALTCFDILFPLAVRHKSGAAAKVAILLKSIAENLQELSKIPPDAQAGSTNVLRDLLRIAEWPPRQNQLHREKSPYELWSALVHRPDLQIQLSVTKFCKERPNIIEPFGSRFADFLGMLTKNITGSQHALVHSAAYLPPPPKDEYPDQVHKLLLDGVKRYAACILEDHVGPELQGTAKANWHITRLCLESGFCSEDQRVLFKLITTASKMTHWQELAFRIPIMNTKSKNDHESQQSQNTFDTPTLIANGDACKSLDNPIFAGIRIELGEDYHLYQLQEPEQLKYIISRHGLPLSELLKLGDLTVEQKVKLSYTVARAFWRFYNSELMNTRWTSEDIFLFRLDQQLFSADDILLRAFVSFPFRGQYKEPPAESYDEGNYTHRYPRILCLGIILLEIGLGQAIAVGNVSEFAFAGHANLVHMKARRKLEELKDAKWDAFGSKDCFVEAVENCLHSVNFNETNRQRSRHKRDSSEKPDLSERRNALYQKVVAPLSRLAVVGFEGSDEPPLIRIPNEAHSKSISANGNKELQNSWDEIHHAHSSFLSGPSESEGGFFPHLQVIAGHINRCRRLANTAKPIRVAILDTGCQKKLDFFKDNRRSKRLRGWKDFTMAGSQSAIDTFGHGTFMARLLMHVAPIADIYVIRVAENTEDLQDHEQNIVKAIVHAGLDPEWKADIISMSFGMPNERKKEYKAISDAIDKVTKERDGSVLFFAAAGNSGIRQENFPASHEHVISIYATNSDGDFLGSNPSQPHDGPKLLGAYGTDIPSFIKEEIRTPFPKADLSAGSSVATAIAARVAAMMLSYVAALPTLLNFKSAETECAKLHTKNGMQQMLYVMSALKGHKHCFINPIGFWGEKGKDMEVFTAVCAAVDQIKG